MKDNNTPIIKQDIRIAVDAVVFGYSDGIMNVLLVKPRFGQFQKQWALVGGFVKNDESLTNAVHRELKEEAGIQVDYLEQLYTFGDDVERDPRFRVIAVAYFALVNPNHYQLKAATDVVDAQWFPITKIPKLGYDHNAIVRCAIDRLKSKLSYQPIGFDLLPKEFLFSDLEKLYSTILGKEIDRRNFRKKILSFGFVDETEKYSDKKQGRPAKLFKFNNKKYKDLVKSGIHFEINYV